MTKDMYAVTGLSDYCSATVKTHKTMAKPLKVYLTLALFPPEEGGGEIDPSLFSIY